MASSRDLVVFTKRHERLTGSHDSLEFIYKQLNLARGCFDVWLWSIPPGKPFDDVEVAPNSWAAHVETFSRSEPILSSLITDSEPELAERLARYDMIFVIDSELWNTSLSLRALLEKVQEYDCRKGHTVLTSCAYRCYPHYPLDDPNEFWLDRRFLRYLGPEASDRAAHIICGPLCVFPSSLIKRSLKEKCPLGSLSSDVALYWLSYVFQHVCGATAWKIELPTIAIDEPPIPPSLLPAMTTIYAYHVKAAWPKGVLTPLPKTTEGNSKKSLTCSDLWLQGFGGINMFSNPVEYDFEAAAAYGARVIRIGAAGGTRDLQYLVNDDDFVPEDRIFAEDEETLRKNIGRLRNSLERAEKAGLRVIITLTNLPGRSFEDEKDCRLYLKPIYFKRLCRLWELLATLLADQRHILAGYDLINEPAVRDDQCDLADVKETPDLRLLFDFFTDAIASIRKHDKSTAIIVESSYWAFPTTFEYMRTFDDPLVVYSFHMYHPRLLTKRALNRFKKFVYPGDVSRWETYASETLFWNRDALEKFLRPVVNFQKINDIPSSRIFVGEFGCCREIEGAARYLTDLIDIFDRYEWSWCVFSFRDPEWDAMDYELGEDIENMLYRHQSRLFTKLTQHFH